MLEPFAALILMLPSKTSAMNMSGIFFSFSKDMTHHAAPESQKCSVIPIPNFDNDTTIIFCPNLYYFYLYGLVCLYLSLPNCQAQAHSFKRELLIFYGSSM